MPSKQFLEEFFQVLKSETAVWQATHEHKDNREKQQAWERLLQKWKEHDSYATMDTVKKKYHGIRSVHNRELKKILESKRSGGEIYVPTLWYYKHLHFLRGEKEMQLEEISTNDDSFEEEIEEDRITNGTQFEKQSEPKRQSVNHLPISTNEDSFEEDTDEEPIGKRDQFVNRNQQPKKQSARSSSHHQLISSHKTDKDEADIYGEAWAVTFRQLSPDQKIFAKRMMDEALMYAQLGQLSIASTINPGFQQVITKNYNNNFINSDESED